MLVIMIYNSDELGWNYLCTLSENECLFSDIVLEISFKSLIDSDIRNVFLGPWFPKKIVHCIAILYLWFSIRVKTLVLDVWDTFWQKKQKNQFAFVLTNPNLETFAFLGLCAIKILVTWQKNLIYSAFCKLNSLVQTLWNWQYYHSIWRNTQKRTTQFVM